MEFGPRALGARSILGDPRSAETQSPMNLKIKFRESFRPFAPAVLAERAPEYFELDAESPYMLLVAPVQRRRGGAEHRRRSRRGDDDMLQMVRQARSDIPASRTSTTARASRRSTRESKPDFHAVISRASSG